MVAITEGQQEAMEDKTFKSLLDEIGINPPANEQVQFCYSPSNDYIEFRTLKRLELPVACTIAISTVVAVINVINGKGT